MSSISSLSSENDGCDYLLENIDLDDGIQKPSGTILFSAVCQQEEVLKQERNPVSKIEEQYKRAILARVESLQKSERTLTFALISNFVEQNRSQNRSVQQISELYARNQQALLFSDQPATGRVCLEEYKKEQEEQPQQLYSWIGTEFFDVASLDKTLSESSKNVKKVKRESLQQSALEKQFKLATVARIESMRMSERTSFALQSFYGNTLLEQLQSEQQQSILENQYKIATAARIESLWRSKQTSTAMQSLYEKTSFKQLLDEKKHMYDIRQQFIQPHKIASLVRVESVPRSKRKRATIA